MSAAMPETGNRQAPKSGKLTIKIRHFQEGREKLVRVSLTGCRGAGKDAVLDASVWCEGRAAGWPAAWITVYEPKSGKDYVATCRKPISQDGHAVPMARLIMGAQSGEVVVFRDGNSLNLRKSNLMKMTEREAEIRRRRFGEPQEIEVIEEFDEPEDDTGLP